LVVSFRNRAYENLVSLKDKGIMPPKEFSKYKGKRLMWFIPLKTFNQIEFETYNRFAHKANRQLLLLFISAISYFAVQIFRQI
jgi:hypothetical protein